MKTKTQKVLIANAISIVDFEGNEKIGMYATKSGYAGISFYKGKGKAKYQALHIYISDYHHGIIEIWTKNHKTCLTLGASQYGAGLSVFDANGKHPKSMGICYSDPVLSRRKKNTRKKPVGKGKHA